ncbi:amino acid--[acyl-carrier-protein] ligase [Gordonia otitidis]|uniref:Aminoacyl-transfer RNA synthetases class-II family profile domain-containing protein n=1 Tax=Gordonia otitidis (strain DSM 44809 / CCUG 52243 / JCM 12355 / NBRC 100426 / IFM 10032) TaxID=1108044 RepID=H5TKJ0_GORO1|nr:amino acid--[acyl-carrier-protein] ligase [Gordonia otitidis]GAB33998.1 hypothetical protein GOOTI_090_00280 [Gordonia otitidis NBRC 100426]
MSISSEPTPLHNAHAEFRDELIQVGMLLPTGIDGLYGRGREYERVMSGVQRILSAAGREIHGDNVEVHRFPPIFPRASYEKTDYIASFPNLTGSINIFTGDDREHAALLADRAAGEEWDGHLHPGETMLVSAACHPSYELFYGKTLPSEGKVIDVGGYCFRHEPSIDPLRMQAFRMREFVTLGTPEQAMKHRAVWVEQGQSVLAELNLESVPVPANDPFFGRAGKMLAHNQTAENLKTELIVRLYGDLDDGTALMSGNYAQDHFGAPFNITDGEGHVAHTACVGIGADRICLAAIRMNGTNIDSWPSKIRARMGE